MENTRQGIAIYSRKSRFTGKGESIGNQLELCRAYIHRQYGELGDEELFIYEDEGFSGGDLNRPAFQRMMADAGKRRFVAIVVYRLDRISRNIGDFSRLIEELSRLNIAFISIREQFDTGSSIGRAMMYMASVFSQLERETIAERIRDNMQELAKTGRWLGGVTPTGFRAESVLLRTTDGKVKRQCRLTVLPEEAQVIRLIYALFLESGSLRITETKLLQWGICTRKGNAYTRFTLKGILCNPVYLQADESAREYLAKAGASVYSPDTAFDGRHGMIAFQRTRQKKGRAAQYLPMEEWILAVGAHQGLIPGRIWCTVQEMLQENCRQGGKKPILTQALLTGLLFCRCGQLMRMIAGAKRGTQEGRRHRYACCGNERCSGYSVDGEKLDNAVIKRIACWKEDPSRLERNLEKLDITACIQGIAQGPHTISGVETGSNAIACRLDWRACVEQMSAAQKRRLIQTVAERIVWDGEAVHLYQKAEP